MSKQPDYELQIKVRNARLRRAIAALGYKSTGKFCRDMGLSPTIVSGLLTMRLSPLSKSTGDWNTAALDVSAAVRTDPELIWPEHMRRKLARNSWTVGIDSEEALLATDALPEIEDLRASKVVREEIERLKPKVRSVIIGRYYDGLTYEELAKERGVSRERMRQTELKGLRDLKKPLVEKIWADQ